ncbi:sulfurtransferase [Variovorax sp. PCZ-1]|uniref:sulfurtransferase n=1 Tax=Variovorax sp. PCZ-1 TaxID=2835533 RepID=UPI001BCDC355|nr:sulfurtransferase [Variovorax sp. PCZ-1]MBS7808482.1 sulfurtransferase [Variovorax sp. PCZ-1]
MNYATLISVAALADSIKANGLSESKNLQIWDCSGDLMNPPAARAAFEAQHIAGAAFIDLDVDLSDKTDARDKMSGGRHPLPSREKFAAWVGAMGVTPETQVIVYDRNGCNYCGRAWWMLQWIGHKRVAVLDGGLQAWVAAGGKVEAGATTLTPDFLKQKYPLAGVNTALAAIDLVANASRTSSHAIIDARAPARFRGEMEPLDPIAGHIPGALNRPFTMNLDAQGFFKSPAELKSEFDALLGNRDPSKVIHHCGSGVSAVPNVLAMAIAGYPPNLLFAGSWSEWSMHSELPVAIG